MKKLFLGLTLLASSLTFATDCSFYTCGSVKCDSKDISKTFERELTEGENQFRYQPTNSEFSQAVRIQVIPGPQNLDIRVQQNFETHSISTSTPTDGRTIKYVYNASMGGKVAQYAIECK